MIQYLFDRLNEPSTWCGVIGLIMAAGLTLAPEQQNAIIALGLSVIGAINVFRSERKP